MSIILASNSWYTFDSLDLMKEEYSVLYPEMVYSFQTRSFKEFVVELKSVFAFFRYGWLQIAEVLLEKRNVRIINLQNNQGKTPLHYACHEGHEHITKLLLMEGATLERWYKDDYLAKLCHVTRKCWPIHFHKFVKKEVFLHALYNKPLNDWSRAKQV